MKRSLELYSDGRLYELEEDQAIKVAETHGQVDELISALQFSTAKAFTIAPPNQPSPDVPVRRGAKHLNQEGFKLLTTFEGCKLNAYDDGSGVWTIGYGHTKGVSPGMSVTQTEAEDWLREDLERFESYVEDAVQVDLNDSQFSALVCFCFNVGPGSAGFGGSTLLKRLNTGDYQAAANQFPVWNKVDGSPWLGLTRRRLAERSLFLGTPWQPFLTYEGTAEEFTTEGGKTILPGTPRTLKLTLPLMEGEDVRQVQTALNKAGFNLAADGFWGKSTEQAVRLFQQQKQLTVDGQVGAATRKALGL
jgi:lysozyme